MNTQANEFVEIIKNRTPGEKEFHQAVSEFTSSIWGIYEKNIRYQKAKILEKMCEPERTIIFRIPWVNDIGEVEINRGYRVEFNSAIGPYKGGLRFHKSVNLSILKFLGFEQTFKNALTSLPMGGGKGGSDFNFRGRSDDEIMRFCQSFMTELCRHIDPQTDVPAGDIGVGGREIGYLFGQYKRIKNEFTGIITGKGLEYGGSLIRPEATGFGAVYFLQNMMAEKKDSIQGKKVSLSGFGNVAWGVALKLEELGAKIVTLSGPDGYIHDPAGVSGEKIEYLLMLRASNEDIVEPYANKYKVTFYPNKKPWEVPVDIAMPCATENELDLGDAKLLHENNCKYVVETSNMGCTNEAIDYMVENMIFAPGKAANAGGVAVSGLEMSQNAMLITWSRKEVDKKLYQIMNNIHKSCLHYGKNNNNINYVRGANVSGFIKVANAMLAQGHV